MNPPKKQFQPNLFQINSEIPNWLLQKGNYYLIQYSSFLHQLREFIENNTLEVHLLKVDAQTAPKNLKQAETKARFRFIKSPDINDDGNWYRLNSKRYSSKKEGDRISDFLFGDFAVKLYEDRSGIAGCEILHRHEESGRIKINSSKKEMTLFFQPDTYQVRMQLSAINRLRHTPLREFAPLYDIFGSVSSSFTAKSDWAQMPEPDWIILTDDFIEGIKQQREFVRKALYSPDFAILDGPPGSGKTTTIIELVLQLAKLGKRILLCSSTHVAIDNVLERILGENDCEKCEPWVMPVRIATFEDQISKEIVKPYEFRNLVRSKRKKLRKSLSSILNPSPAQIAFLDYLKEDLANGEDSIERLILESANLVAGTCTGILQHPDIRSGKGWPEFDYLIVDEASKVTFQDFVMPALHAKRWVLVGDVHQLSPYVDDDSLEHFINNIIPDEGERNFFHQMHAIRVEFQKARQYGEVLTFFGDWHGRDLEDMASILQGEGILAISLLRGGLNAPGLGLQINSADVLLCQEHTEVYTFLKNCLRVKSRLLNKAPGEGFWVRYQQALHLNRKGKVMGWNFDFTDRSWGNAVVSKITQYYSFRENSEATLQILQELESLIPKHSQEKVMDLKRIAFPSILEVLQRGADMGKRQNSPDVFSSGLSSPSKECRFVSVQFQHRMHPDIAEISKDYFYSENGNLQPGSKMKTRAWHFRSNPCRVEWYSNSGKNTGKKDEIVNSIEADHMLKILCEFIDESTHLSKTLEVAVLTFYRDQEALLMKMLRKLFHQPDQKYEFLHKNIKVSLCTVDRFQGQEADLVLLGFTKVGKWAHFNSPNRLNVALTRARHKLILFGNKNWFANYSSSEALQALANRFPSILHT
ncbi:MAG: AAA family ATPase [Bacteroidia bacterium]|nr:AAA family ATPase [Bacteroidia bacterium]